MKLTSEHGEFHKEEELRLLLIAMRRVRVKATIEWNLNAKENGIKIKRMSQEEFDKEEVEMKVQLGILMEQLQESVKDQRFGWRIVIDIFGHYNPDHICP